MIITKEQQEALVDSYIIKGHSMDACIGFVDGLEKALELVDKLIKIESEKLKTKRK